jgi:hypothetical protein
MWISSTILITNDAKFTRENKSMTDMAKAAFNKKTLFTGKLGLNLWKKLFKYYASGIGPCSILWRVYLKISSFVNLFSR